ncbi:glycoside hydrolase family 3 C-terminal domain-containing protein [Paludibacter sp.]|uniref:glycoside hydrolase family 3 C-terminal domain-containing protein n=1 Tax=Paludibacter sp. TaxID=1898105 RepID=UPI001354A0C8|nr:glycoside hydrolase family 3 C-terminal domain-containing protein [Paludibacter sp.]MTK54474.1 carbohydrate-binding protein [Paludibacter sp.]
MKHKFIGIACAILCGLAFTAFKPAPQKTKIPIYLNTAYSFDERAADLVSRLTLEEKESLLGNNMAAVPRLGIHAFNVWSEALHGVSFGFTNGANSPCSFSNSAALGSAWDPNLMQREAAAIADEARALNSPVITGLTYYSPVVEPIRDPRWGRTGESYGEDPFLVSQIASGFIKGMMGNDPTYLKTVPCGKHYFANNSEFNRHDGNSVMDGRDMREFYISPYKQLIEQDKLPSIMSSYNAVNGVPTSASKFYLDTIARRTYGLKGYITGDCSAVEEIYSSHHYAKTPEEAAAMGLKAGVDIDCGSVYQRSAIKALNQGLITVADIDKALVNIFAIRMRTGEFDPSAKVAYNLYPKELVGSKAHLELAKEVATRTPVLLKNDNSTKTIQKILPLNPAELKKIALIGPQADKVELGPYSGRPAKENMVSPYAGIKKYISDKGLSTEVMLSSGGNTASKSNLLYIAGFELRKANGTVTKYDATKFSSSSKGITTGAGMGTEFQVRSIDDGSWTAYENVDLTEVDTIGISLNVLTEGGIIEARVGSPEGNLLTTLNATVAAGFKAGGPYGGGKLTKVKVNKLGLNGLQTLYFVYKAPADAKVDEQAIATAASADAAVVFVGTDENTATEEADRLSLVLPGNQVDLIKAVAAVNPNTIVVMQTLGCVEVEEFKSLQNIPGIIWVGYNGQVQGAAIADILFGDANPGGKLNGTWYKSVKDLPDITDYTLLGGNGKNGRTFWYFNKDVSYEFGYGLSYTTFKYDNFKISKNTITPHDKITVSVDVTNTGNCAGDEVVQVYMRTPDSPAVLQRPIKRLKGFQRVTIPRGQTKTVNIDIDCADLWFWDMKNNKITFDQGNYLFEIGASSKDIKGTVSATMNGTFKPELKVVVADCNTVVLKSGATTQTSVTAAMTDDSFYDITKTKIVYSSNNPAVATVDSKGVVTAKASGVATITAAVTVDNKTVEGNYPIKVVPDLNPVSITVNKKVVPGFNVATTQYSYLQGKPSSKAPVVVAVPSDPDIAVETQQAKGVPGTATVLLTDYNTFDTKEYAVNFGIKSVSAEFDSNALGKQWHWVRENAAQWSLSKKAGSLTITSGKGDITEASNNAENILLQSANTDWTIETKLVCSRKPSGFSQNAGLVAYQDDNNFVKLVYRAGGGGRRGMTRAGAGEQPGSVELSVESNGSQKSAVTLSMDGIIQNDNTLILKLVKKGAVYTASCSADGVNFKPVGSADMVLKDIQSGVMVCDGVTSGRMGGFPRMQQAPQPTTPFEVAFDYFRIINNGLK